MLFRCLNKILSVTFVHKLLQKYKSLCKLTIVKNDEKKLSKCGFWRAFLLNMLKGVDSIGESC
jgi:hypothetical protein